jgi:uncharacterized repeat protein (TIGR01451 family)
MTTQRQTETIKPFPPFPFPCPFPIQFGEKTGRGTGTENSGNGVFAALLAVLLAILPTSAFAQQASPHPVLDALSSDPLHLFGASSYRVEVRPQEASRPVQAQQLFVATVYDDKGTARRQRRVEWVLEGAGTIVKVDDNGILEHGHKTDNHSAVTHTSFREQRIPSSLPGTDDVVIQPGQTWCLVSSAVEGDSFLTVYLPDAADWENHKVVVTTHWVDAEWRFPPPVAGRAGTAQVLTTSVYRHNNRQPLAGYRVRYRLLDGPAAVFLPGRTSEDMAVTDAAGNASVALVQAQPRAGNTNVAIEISRPADPSAPNGPGIVIATGETRVDWAAAQLSLTSTAPPTVPLGKEVPVTINVSNTGQVVSQEITVRDTIPADLQYVRSDPPANVDGNQLIWTLSGLSSGRGQTLQAVFRTTKAGPITSTVQLKARDGQSDQSQALTTVTVPQLAVQIPGPPTAIIGVPFQYQLQVANSGNGTAENVVVTAEFDTGLEHDSKKNLLQLPVGTIPAGEARTVPLTLTPRQAGALTTRVIATADGNLKTAVQHSVTAQRAQLKVDIKGPDQRYQGRPAEWKITVQNAGETPLGNVVVHDLLPPELAFTTAGQGGRLYSNEVVWPLGTLAPAEHRELDLTTSCVRLTPKALNVALVTADPGLKAQAEAPIEIDGVPAFRLEVHDSVDPIDVGGRLQYRIDVSNQGTLAGSKVEVIAIIPAQLKVLTASGPGQPRFEPSRVVFPPLETLPPGQVVSYTVDVQAVQPGDARFRAELRAATLTKEVLGEESTTILPSAIAVPSVTPAPATTAEPPVGAPVVPGRLGQ